MKKLIAWLLSVICILQLCGCNGPYRRRMKEYYSNDAVFENVSGIIREIERENYDGEIFDMMVIYLTRASEAFTKQSHGDVFFRIWGMEEEDWGRAAFKVGDKIDFISAPRYFFDGHKWPIVAIVKDGVTYLEYEKGKAALLDWVEHF